MFLIACSGPAESNLIKPVTRCLVIIPNIVSVLWCSGFVGNYQTEAVGSNPDRAQPTSSINSFCI